MAKIGVDIHGIMDGEAFRALEKQRVHPQVFNIC